MTTCIGCIHAVVCSGYDNKKTGCEHFANQVFLITESVANNTYPVFATLKEHEADRRLRIYRTHDEACVRDVDCDPTYYALRAMTLEV